MKQCVDQLLPLLNSIINESLTKGEFPIDFKNAIVKPLLKKPSLDKDELKNYRPVSNLYFISKVIEKLVAKWLEEHMSEYSMTDPMQSAYKLVHSTETALRKINYDILSVLFLYPVTFPQPSILLITTYSWTGYNICMGPPVLPLNGSSRTLNRETTRFVLEAPFHKDGQ